MNAEPEVLIKEGLILEETKKLNRETELCV